MKKICQFASFFTLGMLVHGELSAQCAGNATLGTASNMFTIIRNGLNPVAADKDLNMIAFIHRNNASAFGGNSGQMRYDISTNAGSTWSLDVGVLNPTTTHLGRYPNLAIYNPTLNTNPANSYVSYMGATFNSLTAQWNGVVTGVQQVYSSSSTETYNQPIVNPQLIPHSLVKGAPGVFWAIDALYNGFTISGFAVYKGTWSSSANDIVWAHNYSVAPTFNLGPGQDWNIGFDPTGTNGWFCTMAHVSGGPTTSAYYPTLWRTTNGGASWTGPISVDLGKFGCMSSFIGSTYVPSASYESDLVVDVYGNPHIFTTIMNSLNYGLYYGQSHWMFDITMLNGVWAAYPVASVNGAQASWGTSPDIATLAQAPQAARTADGSKVFFTWADNSNYSLGAPNSTPNLFTKAFDVAQKKWTQAKDVTSCNSTIAGKILFPHLAPEVLQPSNNSFKLAPVFTDFSVPGQPIQVANFHFIDNVTYAASEFTVSLPSHSVVIAQGSNLLLCPGSTVNVFVSGAGEAIWNTGATTPTIAVSSSTNNVYIVTAQKNCYVGSDTITVTNLTVSAAATSGPACPGNTVAVSAFGNATSYTWMPGNITGSTAVLVAGNTPDFTLKATGTDCIAQQTVTFTLLSPPTITILGPDTACAGNPTSYTATGASTYEWSDSGTSDVFVLLPIQNTSFTVVGTAANSCTNMQSRSILVIPSPTLLTSSSHTAICPGQSATLVALGAFSYSWSTGSLTNAAPVSPASTETFMVTGYGQNGCPSSHTYTMIVHPLPDITVASTRTFLCKGEKTTLTAGGAVSYTWTNPVSTNSSIAVSPTVTTKYIVTGKNAQGCVKTFTYSQVVDPCLDVAESGSTKNELLVYPNPTQGSFIIETLAAEVEIFNQLGERVRNYKAEEFSGNKLIVENLEAGMYFVRCGNRQKSLVILR